MSIRSLVVAAWILAPMLAAAQSPQSPTSGWVAMATVAQDKTNVRGAGDINAPVVTQLMPGQRVLVKRTEGDWWLVRAPDTSTDLGWVRRDRLDGTAPATNALGVAAEGTVVVRALSECTVVTALMSAYQESIKDYGPARTLSKLAVSLGDTTIEVGKRYGIPESDVVAMNRSNSARYNKILKDSITERREFTEYSTLMQSKMKSCTELLRRDESLRSVFARIHNS
jgi:hypothetical protein